MLRTGAAFFDLDKTIICRSSTLAFTRSFYRHGLIGRGTLIRGALAQAAIIRYGAGHRRMERIRGEATRLCRGWPAGEVRDLVRRNLDGIIVPLIYAGARDLVTAHQAAGHEVIVVSASGQEIVDPIAALLGADGVIATRMVIADGRYTGEMAFYSYGEAKAARMRELAAARGYRMADCYAYSDSVTDLPMLEAVGHPVAVNPDRALRRAAARHGWPVLRFPAPGRPRFRVPGRLRFPAPGRPPRNQHARECDPRH